LLRLGSWQGSNWGGLVYNCWKAFSEMEIERIAATDGGVGGSRLHSHTLYSPEHTLAVATQIVMTLFLPRAYSLQAQRCGFLGFLGFVLAFAGSALMVGVFMHDGYALTNLPPPWAVLDIGASLLGAGLAWVGIGMWPAISTATGE
jgi:hypothetical protein